MRIESSSWRTQCPSVCLVLLFNGAAWIVECLVSNEMNEIIQWFLSVNWKWLGGKRLWFISGQVTISAFGWMDQRNIWSVGAPIRDASRIRHRMMPYSPSCLWVVLEMKRDAIFLLSRTAWNHSFTFYRLRNNPRSYFQLHMGPNGTADFVLRCATTDPKFRVFFSTRPSHH